MINLILSLSTLFSNASVNQPILYTELRNVSVMIINKERSSGGTGSILQSSKQSLILTNKHVCGVIENGGYVVKGKLWSKILEYKNYPKHDLCIIRINGNLGVSLKLADSPPKNTEESVVSGFPRLLPNTITKGHFSDNLTIQIMTGQRPCTPQEKLIDMECIFFGAKAIVESMRAQHTSNLIQPGNSGSGVFNSKGELAGVVFAGSGDISFALIVPFVYVKDFIKTQNEYEWIVPEFKTEEEILDEDLVDFQKFINLCISKRCRKLKFDMIHRG